VVAGVSGDLSNNRVCGSLDVVDAATLPIAAVFAGDCPSFHFYPTCRLSGNSLTAQLSRIFESSR
jgi:hypothetical protein